MMFGLKTCDTCRKARRWLDSQGVAYDFRDLREEPPTRALVQQWLEALGPEQLVNRRSTTWRGLTEAQRDLAAGEGGQGGILDVLGAHPALIKRPLFQRGTTILSGFDTGARGVLAGSGAPNQDGRPGSG